MSASRGQAVSERDLLVLRLLMRFRLMSVTQLQRVVMSEGSAITRARRMRSVLQRLRQRGLVHRLARRVGGIHAGSDGTIYRLSGRGLGILKRLDGVQQRRLSGEPGDRFVRHVLAISELYVALAEQTRGTDDDVLTFDAEPASWRSYPTAYGGLATLRPDAFVRTGSGEFEHLSFVEVDLATESLTTINRKCRAYIAFWQSGVEQRRIGAFPRVVWVVPDWKRHSNLGMLLSRLPAEHGELFVVTMPATAAAVLLGREAPADEGAP